jgi:GDP-L-fucose synthase
MGLVLMRRPAREDCELVTVDRSRVGPRRQAEVQQEAKPDIAFLAAARFSGISASGPADFLDGNLARISAPLLRQVGGADLSRHSVTTSWEPLAAG